MIYGYSSTRTRAGFTMVEILLVLALIALATSLVILNANSLLSGLGSRPMPELLRQSVREARYLAALNKEPVALRFDHEQGAFIIGSSESSELFKLESGFGADATGVAVEFFQLLPATGSGQPDYSRREEIPSVSFHPDRSSTPFAVRMRFADQLIEQRYDPFSDLIVEESR